MPEHVREIFKSATQKMKLDEFKDLIAKSLVHKVNGDIKSEVDNDVMKIDTWHVGNYHFDSDDGVVFETTPTGGKFVFMIPKEEIPNIIKLCEQKFSAISSRTGRTL